MKDNNQIYSIIVLKCDNTIIQNLLDKESECEKEVEINNYFNSPGTIVFKLYFINNYINVLNYTNPIQNSLYRIETPCDKLKYTANELHFKPSKIKNDDGLVSKNIKEQISYTFSRNDVVININENKNAYISYSFSLQNIMELYERKYKRIQDVLSNIGGINQAILIIATYINFFYNKFVILSDTETILNSLIYTEKSIHKKKSQKNFNDKMKDIEKEKSLENDIKRNNKKTDINNKNKSRNNKIENTIYIDDGISKTNFKSLEKELKNLKNQNKDSKEIRKIEALNMFKDNSKNKKAIKLSNYICFKISCERKENYFKIYENFRTKIISEEHLIRNHLNLYNILKVTEKKRHSLKNKYHVEDLIKFI